MCKVIPIFRCIRPLCVSSRVGWNIFSDKFCGVREALKRKKNVDESYSVTMNREPSGIYTVDAACNDRGRKRKQRLNLGK